MFNFELELLMFQKLFEEIVKKEKVLASNPQASPPLCVYVCVCACVCAHLGSDASRGSPGCPPVGLEGSSDCVRLPWWA